MKLFAAEKEITQQKKEEWFQMEFARRKNEMHERKALAAKLEMEKNKQAVDSVINILEAHRHLAEQNVNAPSNTKKYTYNPNASSQTATARANASEEEWFEKIIEIIDKPANYDGKENISFDNAKSLVGQTLRFAVTGYQSGKGYSKLHSTLFSNRGKNIPYLAKTCNDETSSINGILGKDFCVNKVYMMKNLKYLHQGKAIDSNSGEEYITLQLVSNETKDTLYYRISVGEKPDFICLKYFDNIKKSYLNDVIMQRNFAQNLTNTDGERVSLPEKPNLVCKDAYIESFPAEIVLVFFNEQYGTFKIKKSEIDVKGCSWISKHHLNNCIKKYGQSLGWDYAYQIPSIGMTTKMIQQILGYPKDINYHDSRYGSSEQWVYKYEYIYIENGKVTDIQSR